MEICVISVNYPSEKHQVHVFLDNLVKKFVDKGIACNVIAPQSQYRVCLKREERREPISKRVTEHGNEYTVYSPLFTSFPALHFGSFYMADWGRRAFFHACLHVYRKYGFRADVIYAHFFQAGVPASMLGKKTGIPVFVANGESDTIKSTAAISRKLIKDTLENVAGIISVSGKCRDEVMQLCNQNEGIREKIYVVPNAADTDRFYKMDRLACRRKLGLPAEAFIVAFVGSFIPRKGPAKVARAVSEAEGVYAVFIGRGPEQPNCRKALFTGTVENSSMAVYLNACNAFVLPTLAEGCCNAIVEAVLCGLPVVSSDRPFNRDILDESCAILIDPENTEELTAAIRKLREDEAFCQTLSQGSMEKAKDMSLDTRADRILAFITSRIR